MRYVTLLFLALTLSGCASGYMPNGDRDYGWYIEHKIFNDDKVYYCKSNKTEKGAVPQCFEADLKNIKQQVGLMN